MRILHVIPVYEPAWLYGGPVRSVSILCRELVKLGVDVTVYTTTSNSTKPFPQNVDDPESIGGVNVYRFPTVINSNYFYSPKLAKKIAQNINCFDLVHITSIWNYPGLPAASIAIKNSVPYLYSARGSLIPEDYAGSKLKNCKKTLYYLLFLKRYFDAAKAIHFSNTQEFESSKIFTPNNVPGVIIPNGIDLSEFDSLPSRAEALRSFPDIPKNSIIISYLGRLHPRKQIDKLIEALAILPNKYYNISLILAGPDDGSKEYLVNLAKELNQNLRVFFPGLLDNQRRKELFAITDIFSFVSAGENFGMALAEAMACGIPVLVSLKVCIQSDIVAANAGLVCDIDSKDIAKKIRFLIDNPNQRKLMSANAKLLVNSRYSKENIAYSMKCAYDDILNGQTIKSCEWVIR